MKIIFEKFGVKIFLAYALFIFFISLSFIAYYIHHQSAFLTDTLIKDGRMLSGILAYNSRIGVFSENGDLLKDPMEGIFQYKGVLEVCVFNLKGELLQHRQKPDKQSNADSGNKPLISIRRYLKILNHRNRVFTLSTRPTLNSGRRS